LAGADIEARDPDHDTVMHGARSRHPAATLRGRATQLHLAGELIAAARSGRGGVLLFEGPPGIGKSRLLAEIAAMSERADVAVARGQAFEGGWTVPFAPLLGALLDARLWERGAPSEDARFWVIEEVHATLEEAALRQPLTVILDDLQWADSGTLVALGELVPRLSAAPVLWVLASRPGASGAQLHRLRAQLEAEGAARMALTGLEPDAVAGLLRDRFGAQPDPGLLAIAETARGNPFWLVELLEGLADERRVSISGGVARVDGERLPARVTQSMRERLDELSDDARQLVRVAAVLGTRFPAAHLAAALRCTPVELVAALDEARRVDLVDELGDLLGFRHDLVREAVLGTLPRTVRQALEREIATRLLGAGAAPADVAGHVAAGAEPGDMDAVRVLNEAARGVRVTDGSVAADLSRQALELIPPDHPARPSQIAETVLMLHAAMRYEEADELATTALARGLPPQPEAELRLSLSAMIMRGAGARVEHNRRALALEGVSEPLRAQHRLWLAHNLSSHGPLEEARASADEALQVALESGGASAIGLAQLSQIMVECRTGHLEDALARAERQVASIHAIDEPLVASLLRFHHGNLLAALGRIDEATEVYRFNVARSQRERQAYDLFGWVAVGARLHFSAGRLADARAEAEAGEAMALSSEPYTLPGGSALVARAQIALHAGDTADLQAALEVAERVVRTGSLVMRVHARWTLALAAHAAGDHAAAAQWLTGDEEVPYAVPLLPTDPAFHVQAARIAVAAGDERVAGHARALLERLERANPNCTLLAGFAAHACGVLDGDRLQLERAVELQRGSERPLPLASALEDAGRALGRRGVGLLEEALALYSCAGAAVDAQRVVRRLRAHGVRRRLTSEARPSHGWASLTESELRVATLVASGATNRDVAAELVLSPHTVSTHLRHAFAKLGINSRVELARLAAHRELVRT
jgi:DNA-binding CsgD family transcriptional regulator